MGKFFANLYKGIKEFFRKRIVHLKRRPQILPLLFIIISCVEYTFKLSNYSTAAIYVTDSYVAVFVFLITLLSILAIFTYMGAYDKKGKKVVMIVLAILQLVILIVLDVASRNSIMAKIAEGSERESLFQAASDLIRHITFLTISIVLIVTKPFYGKLLKKINTSVKDDEFDDNGDDESIIE